MRAIAIGNNGCQEPQKRIIRQAMTRAGRRVMQTAENQLWAHGSWGEQA